MGCTGIHEANFDQGFQGDDEIPNLGDKAHRSSDDFDQKFDTNTEESSTLVTIKRSSGQDNASDHSELEESSNEMSAKKGKTSYNRTPENAVSQGVFLRFVWRIFSIQRSTEESHKTCPHRRKNVYLSKLHKIFLLQT